MTPEELRERRTSLGLSQNHLARMFGVAPSTVARWEQNANPISVPILVRLALERLEMKANYPENYEMQDCAQCKGKGRLQAMFSSECGSCNGIGSVLAPKPAKPCARCDGDGISRVRSHEPCAHCAGTGWRLSLSLRKDKKSYVLSTALLGGATSGF